MPRLCATWRTERPACQCWRTSTTSATSNLLPAIPLLHGVGFGREWSLWHRAVTPPEGVDLFGDREWRKKIGPPKIIDEHIGINGKIGLYVTTVVGTIWCAYAFAALALFVLPDAVKGPLLLVQWISQTFIQLVMLFIIIVGQNIQGKVADKRAQMTFEDAAATLHEAEEIQRHLAAQDGAVNALLERLITLEASVGKA
jgi:hypothetical protein